MDFGHDVTLDLRRGQSGQPYGASVLFLENGGGKTVLVRLIFSVILPGRRQVVGTSNSKVLEKFVNDKEADTYLTREYRKPFVVPEKV